MGERGLLWINLSNPFHKWDILRVEMKLSGIPQTSSSNHIIIPGMKIANLSTIHQLRWGGGHFTLTRDFTLSILIKSWFIYKLGLVFYALILTPDTELDSSRVSPKCKHVYPIGTCYLICLTEYYPQFITPFPFPLHLKRAALADWKSIPVRFWIIHSKLTSYCLIWA